MLQDGACVTPHINFLHRFCSINDQGEQVCKGLFSTCKEVDPQDETLCLECHPSFVLSSSQKNCFVLDRYDTFLSEYCSEIDSEFVNSETKCTSCLGWECLENKNFTCDLSDSVYNFSRTSCILKSQFSPQGSFDDVFDYQLESGLFESDLANCMQVNASDSSANLCLRCNLGFALSFNFSFGLGDAPHQMQLLFYLYHSIDL